MKTNKLLLDRIEYLIQLAGNVIATRRSSNNHTGIEYVANEIFNEFRTSSLSFIINLYGNTHPYYLDFQEKTYSSHPHPITVEKARGILSSIKIEIEKGWLIEYKSLITSEIFSDFLEMAKYFLDEGYKDASAVIIGGTLEENLRQIALKNSIEIQYENNKGEFKNKKAETLNTDIEKKGVYNKLEQKQVTAWLDIRNKAAHGKYTEYEHRNVELMYLGVLDFIGRFNN